MNDERNIKIRLVRSEEVPEGIGGSVFKLAGDDNYLMLINGSDSDHDQIVSFLHECLHIWHRDHDREVLVTELERERHDELEELLKEMQHL